MKVAGAPISWGICEVPGWGHQLAPERVLAEARGLGLRGFELGPDGFLPDAPAARAAALAAYGLEAAGGFQGLVLHDPGHDPLPEAERALDALTAAAAPVLVLAAVAGDGYDARAQLEAGGWDTLLRNLEAIEARAAERGVTAAFHPHAGTLIERPQEVERVLAECSVPLCLDTGHLLIGGGDPAALARREPGRIAHVHLKDVDAGLAARVRRGELPYTDAVRAGLYRPLGRGDVDVAGVVATLEAAGYGGWYVMEQDAVLAAEPDGEGALADVRASLAYLQGLGG